MRFLGYDNKMILNKGKNQQPGLHQTKKFFTAKKKPNKIKGQHIEWEKIFVNHISDKGLISKIIGNLHNVTTMPTTNKQNII